MTGYDLRESVFGKDPLDLRSVDWSSLPNGDQRERNAYGVSRLISHIDAKKYRYDGAERLYKYFEESGFFPKEY
jgi:hypothetical protein